MKEERKTMFTYAHVKWFYGQIGARVLFESFYKFILKEPSKC